MIITKFRLFVESNSHKDFDQRDLLKQGLKGVSLGQELERLESERINKMINT